jgi:hypothetical protein
MEAVNSILVGEFNSGRGQLRNEQKPEWGTATPVHNPQPDFPPQTETIASQSSGICDTKTQTHKPPASPPKAYRHVASFVPDRARSR